MSGAAAVHPIALALIAAIAWAGLYLSIRLATEKESIRKVTVVVLIANMLVFGLLSAFLHGWPIELELRSGVAFVSAGFSGPLLARVTQYRAIRVIGASRTAPVLSSSTLISASLAVLILGEELTPTHLTGILLVTVGVAGIAHQSTGDETASIAALVRSIKLPLFAACFAAISPIFVKIGLQGQFPITTGVFVMSTTAVAGYLAYLRVNTAIPRTSEFNNENTSLYLLASLCSVVSIAAYYAAFNIAPVVIVYPLVQTTPLFVVILSAITMPSRLERVGWTVALATVVVVVGAILISVPS
jgi:drug/metabolite transporter (DMT)-like permease